MTLTKRQESDHPHPEETQYIKHEEVISNELFIFHKEQFKLGQVFYLFLGGEREQQKDKNC